MIFRKLRNFLPGTLRGRLIISVAAIHAVMMTLFILDLTVRQRTLLLDNQTEQAIAMSQSLATSSAEWIAADDLSGLQELVEAQRRYPELRFVILTDKTGRVLAGTDQTKIGLYVLDLPQHIQQTVLGRSTALVDVAVPAMLGDRHIGWVRVGIGQMKASQKLTEITRMGALYALAAIIIGSLIAWRMGSLITRRLYAVQDTISEVKRGVQTARSNLAGNDEAASIAHEFNSMLDILAIRDAELTASEDRFKKLFNAAAVPLCFVNKDGVLTDFNERFVQTFGYTHADVPTLNEWWQLAYPDLEYREWVVATWNEGIRKAAEEQIDIPPVEYNVSCKSGEILTMVISGTILDDNFLATFFDITKRKEAEEALRENNVLLERIFSSTEFMVAYLDADFNFIRVNRAYAEAGVQTPEFYVGKNHFDLYPDLENEAIFQWVVDTGESYVTYAKPFLYIEHPERGVTYWNWSLQPVKNADGLVSGLILSMVDVTEREKAIAAQHESDERYRTLIEQASDGIFLADSQGNYLDVNPSGCTMLGYTRDEILKLNMKDLVYKDEQARQPLRFGDLRSRKHVLSERVLVAKDGVLLPVEISGQMLDNGNFLGIARDVTERRQAEENLRRSEQKFRALAENIPNVVFQCRNDSRYTFLYLNDAIEKLTGYPKDEFLERGLSFFDLYHPDDLKTMPTPEENNITDINRRPFHVTYRIRHQSGEWRWVDEWGIGVANQAGTVEYLEGVMVDITERKRHELEREAIITVSTALRQATTRSKILNVILGQLIDLFDADGAILVLPDSQTGGLIDEMGRGAVGERMTGLHIPPGQGVCNWVITNKKPYLNNQADHDPLFYRPDLLGDSHCIATVPLVAQEQAIGALWIARRTNITEDDLRLLTAIADIAANAIHRVMLHEQTEQQLQHLIALHQIDLAISANFDQRVTLNVLLKSVTDELKVDAASILLLDPITHTLDFAAGLGFRTRRIETSHVKLGAGCAGRAAQEYRTVSCLDLGLVRESNIRSSLLTDEDFASHYATPLVTKGQVKGILEVFHRQALEAKWDWIDYFETLATQAAIAIESASLFENLQHANTELMLAYDATIEGWSRALDLRDKETEGHTQRVTEMVMDLAKRMSMSSAEKIDLRRGALLHDIGKMGVPDSILLKPGPLSDSEWEIMRQHPVYAYEMLSPITYLKRALEIPYCHHEKWDGSGYPRRLKEEEIPLSARMFSIVDVFDALTSNRSYRTAWSRETAEQYIQEQSGKYFDPHVVEIFLERELRE